MKILYYSPHPTHDIVSEVGYSTHQRETIHAMRKLGHEVVPLIMGGTEKVSVDSYIEGIQQKSSLKKLALRFLPIILINTLKDLSLLRHDKCAASRLREELEKHKPDLVYERGEYLQDAGVKICKAFGVKHFLEINAPATDEMRSFEGPSFLHFLGHRKERNKLHGTAVIFAVSTVLKSYLIEKYAPTAPIHVIPNCINPEKEVPSKAQLEVLEQEYKTGGNFVFGFVGSIFPHHGIDKLIYAFSRVAHEFPQAKLFIIGDGSQRVELEDLADRKLPKGSYVFTGKVPHARVMHYIGIFDSAIMPDSNWYGSPVKVLEYGLLGKCIIAPNNGPLNDLITSGMEGLLVDPGIDNLVEAMRTVVQDKDKVEAFGKNFRAKILEQFTWEHQAKFILSQ